MNFTFETEVDEKLPLVSRVHSGLTIPLYRNLTFRGSYINFNSFISEKYKIGSMFLMIMHIFTLTADWRKLQEEVKFLTEI